MHPLVVISHDNHAYVANTISQANAFGLRAIVLDNASTYEKTREYLRSIEQATEVRYLPSNFGSTCWQRSFVYDDLPDRFFLTDPDLQWNPRLPSDFAEQLDGLCTKFQARAVGFALDIHDREAMLQDADYFAGQSIWDWESQFWRKRISHEPHEIYDAPIDTTFQLLDKRRASGVFRVAGEFTARHLPWYRDAANAPHDLLHMYAPRGAWAISTIAKLILREMSRKNVLRKAIDECEATCDEPLKLSATEIEERAR